MKKAQVNQMFVFLVSTMIIVFAGFLVSKFLFAFGEDTEKSFEVKFGNEFSAQLESVATQYNSEKSYTFRLSKEVESICLLEKSCDAKSIDSNLVDLDSLSTILETDDNLVLFDEEGNLISSKQVGKFKVENGCSCYSLTNNNIEFFFRNDKNVVWVSKLDQLR